MSSIATIRKYTTEDAARVERAAQRFCARHNISISGPEDDSAEAAIDHWLHQSHPEDLSYRRKLWTACYCRALRVPVDVRTTTGWGYIGVRTE